MFSRFEDPTSEVCALFRNMSHEWEEISRVNSSKIIRANTSKCSSRQVHLTVKRAYLGNKDHRTNWTPWCGTEVPTWKVNIPSSLLALSLSRLTCDMINAIFLTPILANPFLWQSWWKKAWTLALLKFGGRIARHFIQPPRWREMGSSISDGGEDLINFYGFPLHTLNNLDKCGIKFFDWIIKARRNKERDKGSEECTSALSWSTFLNRMQSRWHDNHNSPSTEASLWSWHTYARWNRELADRKLIFQPFTQEVKMDKSFF